MNTEHYIGNYNIGDLIAVEDTSHLGVVVQKELDITSKLCGRPVAYMYKILFCGDQTPDCRWLLEDALQRV